MSYLPSGGYESSQTVRKGSARGVHPLRNLVPLGRYAQEYFEIDSRHGIRRDGLVVFVQKIIYKTFKHDVRSFKSQGATYCEIAHEILGQYTRDGRIVA